MSLPLLRLEGTPYEQGVLHGDLLRELIEHNLSVYFARFERELKLSHDETLDRAARYARALREQSPAYYEGMRGIAEGSGFALEAIAALNVRYELFYDAFVERPLPDGCTAFAVLPDSTRDGSLLIGENWDWIAGVRGALLHTTELDGLCVLAFTEAGIFGGKIGLNSAGLGLLINGLTSHDDDWSRLRRPFHTRCGEILRSHRLDDAQWVVTAEPRSCSANFLIAQAPAHVVNLESSPELVGISHYESGFVVHSNHFVDPNGIHFDERNIENNPHSRRRQARLESLLHRKRPLDLLDAMEAMRDHAGYPYSLCFHIDPAEPPEEYYESVVSVIMDLRAKALYISDGPPCSAAYVRYTL